MTAPDATDSLDKIEAHARVTCQAWKIPAASIAIIHNEQSRAFGVGTCSARIDAAPVDAETVFPILSNTKLFVAVALAILIEEGHLNWDTPIYSLVPDFRLGSSTHDVTIAHALTHQSGLPGYIGCFASLARVETLSAQPDQLAAGTSMPASARILHSPMSLRSSQPSLRLVLRDKPAATTTTCMPCSDTLFLWSPNALLRSSSGSESLRHWI